MISSSTEIAGLNLLSPEASDLLRLMGVFGISNYITGVMLILVAWKARGLALTMLAVIPVAYVLGTLSIRLSTAHYAQSQALWGGMKYMVVYNKICLLTFVAGLAVMYWRLDKSVSK